ncbi:MAG: 50S ribosomal protein L10 [Candidatus Aenigmarchaeota archaeon]|nr:50S ribosomal protein L10 [Candidatus Aenigmarchaeota archaeon]
MVQQWKIKKVDELAEDFKNNKVACMIDLHDLPAADLLSIKTAIKKVAKLKMTKKRVIERAFEKSGKKGVCGLMALNPKIPAIIITDENPFKIYSMLEKNKSPALAKAGDIAPEDIVIPKGDTGLPPGPAIADLQKAGLKAAIKGQSISVMEEKVVAKKGDEITSAVCDVLSKLNIKPMEIGINMIGAWEDGIIYEKDILAVDGKEYERKIIQACSGAFNLAYNANYLTSEIAPLKITEAHLNALNLAVNAGIISKETVEIFIQKARAQLGALAGALPENARGDVAVGVSTSAEEPQNEDKKDEKKEEPKEEKTEEEAAAGLGALFG